MTREDEILYAAKASARLNRLAYSEIAVEQGFVCGAQWADETMMIKVQGWIKERAHDYMWDFGYECEKAIEDLMKYVEGEI